MSRILLNAAISDKIDHRDGNKLNNRRNNLRICAQAENAMNRKININNTSGYKGVYWNKPRRKWVALIGVNKKRIHLGMFSNKINAAKAYNDAAIKYHGEFSNLNKI